MGFVKSIQKVRKAAACCIPVQRFHDPHPNRNINIDPVANVINIANTRIGAPKRTSTPLETPVKERFQKKSSEGFNPNLLNPDLDNAISDATEYSPVPSRKVIKRATPRLKMLPKRKSNRSKMSRRYVLPSKDIHDLSAVLPLREDHDEIRRCSIECIVCALVKPELRNRHHTVPKMLVTII